MNGNEEEKGNTRVVCVHGTNLIVFCDYAASGRSLQFIEEYILREVLPTYGNTPYTTSISSLQTTLFRQEARDIIRTAVNASEDDAVIFSGHGCSDALAKIITALDLRESPVIFTGSTEHFDNLHLWQKTGAKLVRIGETKEGLLDLTELENQLKFHQNCGRQLIGCFSVASSVTGIVIDDLACTILLHQYGALSFWDFNVGAPCLQIDMNPAIPGVEENSTSGYKDAIYFSGHKFIGGVQTPGILIAKKCIFRRLNTCDPDGFFVSNDHDKSFDVQEDGSCAAVVESIRAGLVMQLKETVSVTNIVQRQEKINKQMLQHIRTIPEVILLGNNSPNLKRISVFSFMVRHPRGSFLHHNFVCAVLNDVFGIQARAGCPCSGAYAQELLGIDQSLADQYESIILEDRRLSSLNLGVENSTLELLRPGFTRISLPYFITDAELAFIMEAVKMVATEGWKLLPQYVVDLETAEWRHHTNAVSKDRKWLSSIRYLDGKMTMNERRISGPGLFPQSYSECLQTARNLFNRSRKAANRGPYQDQGIIFDSRGEKLRWFMLQHEAQNLLTSNAQNVKQKVPFDPLNNLLFKRDKERDKSKDRDINPSQMPANGSPRHFSLPAIDDPKVLTCSSPVPYFLQDVNGLYYPQISQPSVNFAVGEAVSSTNLNHLQQNFVRERCLSLGAPTVASPVLSPSTRVSLGMQSRQRQLSYSSQEPNSLESDSNQMSPTHSLSILSNSFDCLQCGRSSPAPDLQTYVTEMTKEIATNIKSEIREVISKVEDALENTDSVCSYYERHGSGSEDGRSDSISANEVAEYLEKVSIEMANEVKSEIREVVSAVDVFITPDNTEKHPYSRTSSLGTSSEERQIPPSINQEPEKYTPGSSTETVLQMINKSASSDKLLDNKKTEEDKTQKSNKVLSSTVASVSSQDSGINLSFHEQEHFPNGEFKSRSNSESLHAPRKSESEIKFSTLQKHRPRIFRDLSDDHHLLEVMANRYNSPPKTIWEPSLEAISEFEMVKNGDKIMVCLSGEKLESAKENYYTFCTPGLRQRLYSAAKSSGYNVLAIGQHLDDVCESFMLSVFHTGKLRSLRAHYFIRDHDLRVIRPFVYVREKVLRQYSTNENLPVFTSSSSPRLTKESQRIKQVLIQQEIHFPKLFTSLRSALHPLIGFEISECEIYRKRLKPNNENSASDEETDEEPIVKGE
ncbi:unnamed protein product [Psylliodes chrysocephalus]|uniref:Uncharacterized protein n=1 Tax=Psylliodes chrysocephalus TaxID=3402493 RepID=A0A9P0CUH2_9CUCU|nr:unnamed protein product [Psylliodes chrysocephala]